jgi:alkylation response protein AidB-like acyl-CoA dehydrogenase
MQKMFNTPELKTLKETVKKWIDDDIRPNYEVWEKEGIVPRSIWDRAGTQGLLCVTQDEKYGGLGLDFRFSALIYHELFKAGFASLGVGFAVHSDLVGNYISHFGDEAQKDKYLPRLISGENIGAIAMTEPGTGSDLASIKTKGELKGEKWIINGQKTFISNGIHCDLAIVVVRTDTVPNKPHLGLSLFVIEKETNGFTKGTRLKKLGLHAQDTSELIFENCEIPQINLIGNRGEAFLYLMKNLGVERLGIGIMSMGQAQGAFEQTVRYTKERNVFNKPVAAFQNTRFKLAEISTNLNVGYAFLNQCIEQYINGDDVTIPASQAKLWTSETGQKIIDECLQLHGGYGYMDEYPISRFYRDCRVQRIYGGTSEIMKEVISRAI